MCQNLLLKLRVHTCMWRERRRRRRSSGQTPFGANSCGAADGPFSAAVWDGRGNAICRSWRNQDVIARNPQPFHARFRDEPTTSGERGVPARSLRPWEAGRGRFRGPNIADGGLGIGRLGGTRRSRREEGEEEEEIQSSSRDGEVSVAKELSYSYIYF